MVVEGVCQLGLAAFVIVEARAVVDRYVRAHNLHWHTRLRILLMPNLNPIRARSTNRETRLQPNLLNRHGLPRKIGKKGTLSYSGVSDKKYCLFFGR